MLAWTPHHSVIKSLSGWIWCPFSRCATQSMSSVPVHICADIQIAKKVKEKGGGEEGGGKFA